MALFNCPRIYTVYLNPALPHPEENIEFIPEQASLMGFVFHVFWCAYHRLWWQAGTLMALWAVLLAGGEYLGLSMFSLAALEILLRSVVALEGNNWRQNDLRRRGYILTDIVTGEGEITAKQRFYQRWLEQA